MRLIHVKTFKLEEFFNETIPSYAILSHTWGNDDEEVSFRDITEGNIKTISEKDGLKYAWIDTCCIDKTNSVELGEAINSMFEWYRKASVCYVYLSDVTTGSDFRNPPPQFSSSRWFQRGWTLQELLAPRNLLFYDSKWQCIGTKSKLSSVIEMSTGIPRPYLLGVVHLTNASVAQRMSWASKRTTKRKEDIAYCLLGIFGVMMPMIYGEGNHAFTRLQREIIRNVRDDSIFAWGLGPAELGPIGSRNIISAGMFAASPTDFVNCGHIVSQKCGTRSTSTFTVDGGCVRINLSLYTNPDGELFGLLNCGPERSTKDVVGIPLCYGPSDEYIRPQGHCSTLFPRIELGASTQLIYVLTERQKMTTATTCQNWFYIEDPSEVGLELIEVEPQDRWWKENSLIATASDSVDDVVQQTWTRFRPEGEGFNDFLLLLEFGKQNSQVQARCHIMISSKATALEDVSQESSHIMQAAFGRQSASDGTLIFRVTLERDTIAGQEMFVVKLAKATSSPNLTVNATFELEVLALKLELESTKKEEEELRLEAENLNNRERRRRPP
ncbi:heterokaryon incompatibility protein-domain-containing protein [Xylogone sp. PMI_703]|nr:heterokaryon incompatibility protein-domain-containing protein [Xylogone sp. PMI_703]